MEIITIKEKVKTEYIIEKSKFISFLFPIDSKEEANKILDNLRLEYKDATHICYGMILFDESIFYKSSDDGEPSQTAGAPILNVLKKNNLCNVLCAVVRYFGGIKLGAGGLTRAYTNSAALALNLASLVTLKEKIFLEVSFEYENKKEMDWNVKSLKVKVNDKIYEDLITYSLLFDNDEQMETFLLNVSEIAIEISDKEIIKVRD